MRQSCQNPPNVVYNLSSPDSAPLSAAANIGVSHVRRGPLKNGPSPPRTIRPNAVLFPLPPTQLSTATNDTSRALYSIRRLCECGEERAGGGGEGGA